MSNTPKPLTPEELCRKISRVYTTATDQYTVEVDGTEIYQAKDKRDANLFIAELKASILLRGNRPDPQVQEAKPEKPEPDPKPVVLRLGEMEDKIYFAEEFLPPYTTRVLVSTASHTAIARRVLDGSSWHWKFDTGSNALASEVNIWRPILWRSAQLKPIETHDKPKRKPDVLKESDIRPLQIMWQPTHPWDDSKDVLLPPMEFRVLVRGDEDFYRGDLRMIGRRVVVDDAHWEWMLDGGSRVESSFIKSWTPIPI